MGQWLRIYVTAPNNVSRRRRLLAEEGPQTGASRKQLLTSRRQLRHSGSGSDQASIVKKLFDDPKLQAALNASLVAEAALDAAVAAHPDRVPALSDNPNATNPLGMDPWLLDVARYAVKAAIAEELQSEPTTAPALAMDGTLDAYLYGENMVDSGQNFGTGRCWWLQHMCLLSFTRQQARQQAPSGAWLVVFPVAVKPAIMRPPFCSCVSQQRPHPLPFQVCGLPAAFGRTQQHCNISTSITCPTFCT